MPIVSTTYHYRAQDVTKKQIMRHTTKQSDRVKRKKTLSIEIDLPVT